MKYYKKEDLKNIGYYRTEEQLQERLKELDCYYTNKAFWQKSETTGTIIKEAGFFISKNESMCLGEFINHYRLKKDYVSQDEILTYLSEQGFKIQELFHVTRENIKFVTSLAGRIEKVIFPNWLEERIDCSEIGICRKVDYEGETKFGYPIPLFYKRACLTFEKYDMDGNKKTPCKVVFGGAIALMSDGRLKKFSEEEAKKLGLGE